MNDNPSQDRPFAAESVQVWIYKDNYEELMKLCEENGSKPGDVLRDAFDEWLSSCDFQKWMRLYRSCRE
jgi:hypothetical protein